MKYPITLLAAFLIFASFTFHPNSHKDSFHSELTLSAATKTATSGGEVCVDVTTRDFHEIMSMQYSLKWNTKTLKFKALQKFQLPGLTDQNFGQTGVDKGILTFSWYDQNLRSISMPDGASLYQICFDVIGKANEKSYLQFTGSPTAIEISNLDGNLLNLNGIAGVVKIR